MPAVDLRTLDPSAVFELARSGDRRAIGRLLSLVERGGDPAAEVAELAHRLSGSAHVVGITGSPGAGKSTLTGRLASGFALTGIWVAVLAIDPSSPVTGGAILGDRIRMDEHNYGTDTFIRSMATRGQGGGLAVAVPAGVRALDAVGFELIIVETVGVGQIEVDIAGTADTTVVVVTPGWGDAVQANKAGLLELADVLVVNKADRAGASDSRRDLELMLDLSDTEHWRPEIVLTVATEGGGIDKLALEISRHRQHLGTGPLLSERRRRRAHSELRVRAVETLIDKVDRWLDSTAGQQATASMAKNKTSPNQALEALLTTLD